MKYLITGANGYIGTHLCQDILENGHEIRALVLEGTDTSLLQSLGAEVIFGDIRDYESTASAALGCDAVFHLASHVAMWSKKDSIFHDINVRGTQTLLCVCRDIGIKRILICSSCGIFGPSHDGHVIRETKKVNLNLTDPYEASKFRQVEISKKYIRHGLEIVFVFPTRVFGPGIATDGNSLTQIFGKILEGKWKIMFSDGENIGNYIFVRDVVSGMRIVMEKGFSGEGYILGAQNLSYNSLFEAIKKEVCRGSSHLFHIHPGVLRLIGRISEFIAGMMSKKPFITVHAARKFTSDWIVSNNKIRRLGFKPTPFEQALRETLAHLTASTC